MALSENRDFEYPTSNRSKNFSHWNMAIGGGIKGIPFQQRWRIEWHRDVVVILNLGPQVRIQLQQLVIRSLGRTKGLTNPNSRKKGVDSHLPTTSKMLNMLCASGKSILWSSWNTLKCREYFGWQEVTSQMERPRCLCSCSDLVMTSWSTVIKGEGDRSIPSIPTIFG